MKIQLERYGERCLVMLACAAVLCLALPAAGASHESVAAANAAIGSSPRPVSGSLIGVTLAPGGLSLAAVAVVIRNVSDSTVLQLMSDPDGNFSARDLPPGIYEIAASKEGYAGSGVIVEVAANKTANANVQLSRGTSGSLRGVALASDGFSIAGVSIALHSVDGSIDRGLITDADGMFMARDLPPGPYQVVGTKPGF